MATGKHEHIKQLVREGKRAEARAALEAVVRADPNDADAWYGLYQLNDDPDRKEFCLKKAYSLRPEAAPQEAPPVRQDPEPKEPTAIILPNEYDTAIVERLLEEHPLQTSFDGMASLKEKMLGEIQKINVAIKGNQALSQTTKDQLQREEAEFNKLGFLDRMVKPRYERNRLQNTLQQAQKNLAELEEALEVLSQQTGLCPTNKEEKKAVISALRTYKKELALEKKAHNLEIQQTRADARRSQAGFGFAGYGRTARYMRTSMRLDKERKVAPHEAEKQRLDRVMIEIDKMIILIERLN